MMPTQLSAALNAIGSQVGSTTETCRAAATLISYGQLGSARAVLQRLPELNALRQCRARLEAEISFVLNSGILSVAEAIDGPRPAEQIGYEELVFVRAKN